MICSSGVDVLPCPGVRIAGPQSLSVAAILRLISVTVLLFGCQQDIWFFLVPESCESDFESETASTVSQHLPVGI